MTAAAFRVLGVDPGTARAGFGVVERGPRTLAVVEYGCIESGPDLAPAERLRLLHERLGALLERHRPDAVAVEELFFARNARSVIGVAQARGVALLAAAEHGVPVVEYTPLQVKQGVVGYGRAEKFQVQHMVTVLLGLAAPPRPDDTADALAIAICHCLQASPAPVGAGGRERSEQ